MATCVNDRKIPSYMEDWLIHLKGKQKDEYSNLCSDDEKLNEDSAGADVPIEEENDKHSSGGSQPPAKWARMRMSQLSRSSCISSVVSVASSVISST